jgi:uncharacterized protein YceK
MKRMNFRKACVGFLLSCLPIAGCGTIANVATPNPLVKTPFGGVQHDVREIQQAANGDTSNPNAESEHYHRVLVMAFCAADLPLSLIGDVVMWPYTVIYSFINEPLPVPPVIQVPADDRPLVSP